MNSKKHPHADLEKRKPGFILIGLVVAMCISLMAFEWRTIYEPIDISYSGPDYITDIEIPAPVTPVKPKPAPKPPQLPPDNTNPTRLKPVDDLTAQADASKEANQDLTDRDWYNDLFNVDTQLQDESRDKKIIEPKPWENRKIVASSKPVFPGGDAGLSEFLLRNTRYPEIPKSRGIEETIYVSFTVDKKGNVINVKRKHGHDPYLVQEALRVVRSMPKWTPGYQAGLPQKVDYVIPVHFRLGP